MKQERGFACVFAVSLIILVGSLLAVLGTLALHDFRRTQEAVASAQLRQLLLAGSAVAVEQSRGWGPAIDPGEISVDLPHDGMALTITLMPVEGEAVRAIVRASVAERHDACTLTFQKKSTGWITSQVD